MRLNFQNKIAVISGGLDPIGKALAIDMVGNGAKVIIWDYNDEKAKLFPDITKVKGIEFYEVDLLKYPLVDSAAKYVFNAYGSIDFLINLNGIHEAGDLPDKDFSKTEFSRIVDLNLTASLNCIKAVSPFMKGKSFGRIINNTVMPVVHQYWEKHHDIALREGIMGMTKVWSRELAKYSITVNTISPGFMASGNELEHKQITKAVLSKIPSGRLCTMEDLVNAYYFLLGERASYINGVLLPVDGGYSG